MLAASGETPSNHGDTKRQGRSHLHYPTRAVLAPPADVLTATEWCYRKVEVAVPHAGNTEQSTRMWPSHAAMSLQASTSNVAVPRYAE